MSEKANNYFSRITVFCLCLNLSMTHFVINAQQPAVERNPLVENTNSAVPVKTDDEIAGERVKLYYFRNAATLATLLTAVTEQSGSLFKNLIVQNASEDEIILYGPKKERVAARRIIVTLDLPRPGINMDMWGVQISSRNPQRLAEVMFKVRSIIDETQQDIRKTFTLLQESTRRVIKDKKVTGANDNKAIDSDFKDFLECKLGYTQALDTSRPLSFTDILLLMIAPENPGEAIKQIAEDFAKSAAGFQTWKNDPQYKDYIKNLPAEAHPPLERFFKSRGLEYANGQWLDSNNQTSVKSLQSRAAIARFAYEYKRLVHEPDKFSPYYLQQAAETVNSRMQNSLDALRADLQDLFIIPTLFKIQKAVRDSKDVEYALVGKTSVATLSGISTEVSSSTVSTFEERPPLKLSELLTKATSLSGQISPFDPVQNTVGALPLSQVIGLIGAIGDENSVWRELNSGVSIGVTPNVLRNMTSAELKLDLKTSGPDNGTKDTSVPPLSRVAKHEVKTNVYVNALDFFDISSFNSESTLGGKRGYVPVVGPIWRGLFYDIPVFGRLFSWKRDPQTVHHESLLLTTSFIMPTVMGVALLYPNQDTDKSENTNCSKSDVDGFVNNLQTKILQLNQ